MKNKSYRVEEPDNLPNNIFSSFSQSCCTTIVNGKVVEKKAKQVSYDGKKVKVKQMENERVENFEYDQSGNFDFIENMEDPFGSFDKIFGNKAIFGNKESKVEEIKTIKNKK
jgi:hypothetical protein